MSEHQHDYRKLNDEAVFCRGCGDIKSVAPALCTLPHYPMVIPYTWPPYTTPWHPPTYPWWTVTSGTITTGTVEIGNTVYMTAADFNAMSTTVEGIA